MFDAATEGCELEDCADKAVVLFYVQEALANVTNAYLAFSTVSDTVLYSEEDFEERAATFADTLQEVANLNANLTDYFVREAGCLPAIVACCMLHAASARPPTCPPHPLSHCLSACAVCTHASCGPHSRDALTSAVLCILCCAAHHQRVC